MGVGLTNYLNCTVYKECNTPTNMTKRCIGILVEKRSLLRCYFLSGIALMAEKCYVKDELSFGPVGNFL